MTAVLGEAWRVREAPDDAMGFKVIPVGRPEGVSETVPLKVGAAVTVRVVLAVAPRLMLRELGEKARVKLGVAMVSVTMVVAVTLPEVPVMVMVWVPAAAVDAAVRVRVVLVPTPADAGLKVAVTPLGRPVAVYAMVPLKPLVPAEMMEEVPELGLEAMLIVEVPAVKVKPGTTTLRLMGVLTARTPEVPMMLMVAVAALAVGAAVRVRVVGVPWAVEAGLKVAVTPAGRLVAL